MSENKRYFAIHYPEKKDFDLEEFKTTKENSWGYFTIDANYVQMKVIEDFRKKIDEIILQGLKNKGFDFSNMSKEYISHFIKTRCSSIEQNGNRVFYVDEKPFLLYVKSNPILELEMGKAMTHGEYQFL